MERGLVLRQPLKGWAVPTLSRLLPGGHACVFGTFKTALEAEDAGFEVRDCIIVLGAPSSMIWLLRKPLEESTVAAQVLKTGTGALWIDGCRVLGTEQVEPDSQGYLTGYEYLMWVMQKHAKGETPEGKGRWPSNLVLMHEPECLSDACACPVVLLDEQSGITTSSDDPERFRGTQKFKNGVYRQLGDTTTKNESCTAYGDTGGASRFFPRFRTSDELEGWLLKLVTGP